MASKPQVTIYCDGACSPNPNGNGGYGVVMLFGEHRKEISGAIPNTTNNRMELTAAIEALKLLKKPCQVILHTDSQYVCQAFNQKWIKNWKRNGWLTRNKTPVLNKDLWEILDVQASLHEITWKWVRGHASNEGNNRCDQLAVQARKSLT